MSRRTRENASRRASLLAFAAGACSAAAVVDPLFAELRMLRSMQPGERYTARIGDEPHSGPKEDFLRRRTAAEISASGLSCGCGDFAVLFLERIRARGFATLFVDSAQLSLPSLAHTFSGHAVVALRPADAPSAPWWLVDPTARQVLSRDWPTDAKTFTSGGRDYWIGNCGPLERYPVRSSRELKQFYAATLATVPSEIFNRALPRFVFTIDPLLEDGRGAHLNPRVLRLPSLQDELFGRYRIVPDREIAIHLTRGSDDAMTHLKNVEGRWIAHLGLRSACSASLLDYFAAKTRRGARWNFEHPIVRGCERERVALPAVDLPALATPSPGFLRDTTRAGRRKNPT